MITIVDYGAGNIGSVDKAFQYLGVDVKITKNAQDIMNAQALVLPGVGAYEDAMNRLNESGCKDAVCDYIRQDRPFLGICLGLQLLFDYSEEGGNVRGLGIFPGSINLFSKNPQTKELKIPQIGWNSIEVKSESRFFKNINSGDYVYFVHSYYLESEDESMVSAKCSYGINFHAAIEKGNVFAVQFHPEKSGTVGLKILENFIKEIRK